MNFKRFAFAALLTGGLAAVLPLSADAQYPGQGYGRGPDPALLDARRQLKDAEAIVTKIRSDMNKIKVRFSSRYEGKTEWEEAQKAMKKAKAEYNAANKKAMARLQASKEYQAQKEKLTKADEQVEAVQGKRKIDKKALDKALQDRTDAALAIRKLESNMVREDPALVEAKQKLADAKETWQALQEELDEAVKQDPDYQAMEVELETAQANVDQMKMALQQQQMAAREARRAQMEAERQQRSGGRSGGGYGGY